MRKLYNEFFYISKHGKVREKVMLTRIVMTVTIIVMCLAAMSFTAYAYFSYNITSDSNTIKAASFYTDVMVQISDASGNEVEVITSDHISHWAKGLEANKTYFITLKHTDRSTSQTGFVILTATGCETRYHTQQLGRDGDGNTQTITFTVVPGANTDVTFYSHWGTSSFYADFMEIGEKDERYIISGDDVKLTINGEVPSGETSGTEDSTNTSDETITTPSTEATTPAETTTEIAPQTMVPAATDPASTEATTETNPATESTQTTGTTNTEASE